MTRYRLLLAGSVICVGVITGVLLQWALTPSPGMTRENFKRLHAGMTLPEMEAIMGRPPDHQMYMTLRYFHLWIEEENVVDIEMSFKTTGEFRVNGHTVETLASAK